MNDERDDIKVRAQNIMRRIHGRMTSAEWAATDEVCSAIADHLIEEGFRKTLDVSELVEYDLTRQGFVDKGALVNEKWYRSSEVRRLAAPKERWVAVTERLPEAIPHSYQGCGKLVWDGMDCFICELHTDGEWHYETGDMCGDIMPKEDVTHWQPLPNPPTL